MRYKSEIRCYNCQTYGHFIVECRKPRRIKEAKHEALMAQTDEDEPALLLAEYNKTIDKIMLIEKNVAPRLVTDGKMKEEASNIWYLDNGARNHMTGDEEKFLELNKAITGVVKFGDSSAVKIEDKGSVVFKCKTGEERLLREVFYIPSLCSNIIS